MLPLRYPWVWWLLGWALVIAVIAGSLVPGAYVSGFSASDKLLHAGSYLVLMVWFSGLYRRERHIVIALLLLVLGFTLDLVQGAYTTRVFDWLDVTANAAGILAGLLLSRFVLADWCRRVERLVFSR